MVVAALPLAGGVRAQECPVELGFTAPVFDVTQRAPFRVLASGPAVSQAPALVFETDPSGGDAVEVLLERLHGDGTTLDGQYVRVASDRIDPPGAAAPGKDGQPDFRFAPNDPETEDCFGAIEDCSPFDAVNVYYHIDRMATVFWRDRMGIDPDFQADVVTHISGDGAFADPARDLIKLGVGWTFMRNAAKEDEIIYHEYTHLVSARLGFILDIHSPVQAQALSEGYADYFAATFTEDPRIGEWIVTCPDRQHCEGPPNDTEIRTLDTDPTVWNWVGGNPATNLKYGVCTRFHEGDRKCKTSWNNFVPRYTWAIIWGSLLWDLREELGPDVVDFIALEAMRRSDGSAETLERAAGRLVEADELLFAGAHGEQIGRAATARGITVSTAVEDLPEAPVGLSAYPLPASGGLTVDGAPTSPVRIFDASGRLVAVLPPAASRRWEFGGAPPGLYFLRWEGSAKAVPVVVVR